MTILARWYLMATQQGPRPSQSGGVEPLPHLLANLTLTTAAAAVTSRRLAMQQTELNHLVLFATYLHYIGLLLFMYDVHGPSEILSSAMVAISLSVLHRYRIKLSDILLLDELYMGVGCLVLLIHRYAQPP